MTSQVSDNDVIICSALRTPLTKSKRGLLKNATTEELLIPLFEATISRTGLDPSLIEDISIGNALQPGSGIISSRMAQLMAKIPNSTPICAVNRLCSSGLQAVANIASAISAGYINVGIAGGVESMTHFDMMDTMSPEKLSDCVFQSEAARNCLLPMGLTSENVVKKFHISRAAQDALAADSHRKAARAQESGLYKEEMIPVKVTSKESPGAPIIVDKDDGIRPETTVQSLATLKPAFAKDGTTTAGNSSQVSDGAAMVLLARRSAAKKMGLPILARFVSFTVVGVPPEIMGIGPAVAIPEVLKKAGLKMEDIDIFEVNEAFASQAAYCVDVLKIPHSKLNPKGGAIALGHPLGCTGSRMIATLLPELRRTNGRFGIVSMCVGTGMGAAAVIENYVKDGIRQQQSRY